MKDTKVLTFDPLPPILSFHVKKNQKLAGTDLRGHCRDSATLFLLLAQGRKWMNMAASGHWCAIKFYTVVVYRKFPVIIQLRKGFWVDL